MLYDGAYACSRVDSQLKTTISLGNQQIQISLLILPGVIDGLVQGWDFLDGMGTTLVCGSLTLRIEPRIPQSSEQSEEKLPVAAEINRKVDELLAKGCIEPSKSPYSAPIVMVRKKNGSIKDAYPLLRVHHILD
ncbi:hypothetical protein AWZ03_015018 [Drosophila navojoa]|uniref:Reverse transcriptase domain-containing protein n=1 Tax=Drosophila navojoa TaxID=7232 RepID=A0A484ARR0_DRONA|nr:hypothetical protein AWZ03_015018 [Drosophila navojoa]